APFPTHPRRTAKGGHPRTTLRDRVEVAKDRRGDLLLHHLTGRGRCSCNAEAGAMLRRVTAALDEEVHHDAVSVARTLIFLPLAVTLLVNPPRLLFAPLSGGRDDAAALQAWHDQVCEGWREVTAPCVLPAGQVEVALGMMVVLLLVAGFGVRPRWTC